MNLVAISLCTLLVTATDAFGLGGPTKTLRRPISFRPHENNLPVAAHVMLNGISIDSRSTGEGRSIRAATLLGVGASYLDGLSDPSSQRTDAVTTTAMLGLSLETADILADAVIASAKKNNFPPIVVSILDKSANMIVQKRMDGDIHTAFPEFSYAKAYTCVAMGVSSRAFRDKYTQDNDAAKVAQLNSMMAITGKMAAFPGGVVLRNARGEVVGAIGVSGAAGDEDEYMALRAVWGSGLPLSTEPAEHSCTMALE